MRIIWISKVFQYRLGSNFRYVKNKGGVIERGVSIQKWGKNRLGEVAKEAFSSGVETTFPCEQITIGVTSFGELLYQRRSQRRPKQERDRYSTECILDSQKTSRPRREAPRRNVMENKHTEAAPALRAAEILKKSHWEFYCQGIY